MPKISYLYSARIYDGELAENEQILLKLKEYIGGDPAKGKAFYDKAWAESMTDEDILKFITE